jgi:putative tryptophan/tyrosine transport system substrate-binding protein
LRRLALFQDADNVSSQSTAANIQRMHDVGIEPIEIRMKRLDEIDSAFRTARAKHADAVSIPTASLFNARTKQLADLALEHRLPSIGGMRRFVENGGLSSYAADYERIWRQVGVHVDRLLKGAKPADVPFVLGDKFELCLNRKTAAALGLAIAPDLLLQADLVVG